MDNDVLPNAGGDVKQQPPEEPVVVVVDVPPPPPPVDVELRQPEPVIDVPPSPQHNLELPKLVIEFCLTAAIGIAIQSVQNRKQYPLTFHMACLMMVFALASIVVAKYVHQNFPNGARVLENVGVLFGITSFLFAITMSFPIWLTIISWASWHIYCVDMANVLV
ncbi:hypothetical protein Acr_04g0004370 [Actinidia rufa]|uniref:Uncharacterized protein n=1 Tax=Actinidia rufa TaxID=165716 RepID=A0A7J0EIG7_9ERIC|nr:hypothetical protein Acr_04g0004370 [Actinidia rufa]